MSSARRMIVKPRSAGGGFQSRLVDKKMGIVYNPARSSILTPAESHHGADQVHPQLP
jgi:hypothetical protein